MENTESNNTSIKKDQSYVEKIFEGFLWNSRYIVLLAVIFGLISAITLFILGSFEVFYSIKDNLPFQDHLGKDHSGLLGGIIGAVDLYLIGIVLLLFSFGVYELFISKIDIGRDNKEIKILEITSLDELKNKILKVIIMVLIVSFFQRILTMEYRTPIEMFYFALSIFFLSCGIYLMHKAKQ